MKDHFLFFNETRCTGCQLCVMACSLICRGTCGINTSFIKVLTHPKFGTSTLLIESDCYDEPCHAQCVDVCTPRVLKTADEKMSVKLLLHPNWKPIPVIDTEQKV